MTTERKKRHWLLTGYLIFLIIINLLFAHGYWITRDELYFMSLGLLPIWVIPAFTLLKLFNVVCVIALIRYKKWGFLGYCMSASIIIIINLIAEMGLFACAIRIISVIVLFAMLHVGKERKAWPQLA